jgi:hypothetical protein
MRVLFAAAAAALIGTSASAVTIAAPGTEGFKVIAGGGEVIARYEGSTASYTNLLYLTDGDTDYSNDQFLFDNKTSKVGDTVNLGVFAAGSELLFRLYVATRKFTFFTGPAERNPDGQAHACVQSDFGSVGTTLVSFEDLLNGPFHFNDLSYSFTNTAGTDLVVAKAPVAEVAPVPVPAALGLLAGALGGLGLMRRKRD